MTSHFTLMDDGEAGGHDGEAEGHGISPLTGKQEWLAMALRSISDSRLSKSQRKEATWMAMRASMAPPRQLDLDSGSETCSASNLGFVAGDTGSGNSDCSGGFPYDHTSEQCVSDEDDLIIAEINDRIQCIRVVVANAVFQVHGRHPLPVTHLDVLRRNVALHAFKGIGTVSALTTCEPPIRHVLSST